MSMAKNGKPESRLKSHSVSTVQRPIQDSGVRHGSRLPDERLEMADKEELSKVGNSLDPRDPNFQSELNYNGYRSIEESDNDSYNSRDLERNDKATQELTIEDREDESDSGEEDLIDPQENRK